MINNILPSEMLDRWCVDEANRQETKLLNYIELRAWLEENAIMMKHEQMKMRVYEEAARAFRCSRHTVRKNLSIIREYPDNLLISWLANGFSFQHVEIANQYANNRSPADIMNEMSYMGSPEGNEPMTVDEMIVWLTGDKPRWSAPKVVVNLLSKLSNLRVVQAWSDEKKRELSRLVDEIGKLFEDDR